MKKIIIISKNKSAKFEIEIIEKFIVGIVLNGNEIKSIRLKQTSIDESYILVKNNELFILNMYVAPYKNSFKNEEVNSKRRRKILAKSSEIRKINKQIKENKLSAIPITIFINERGFAKLEIALAKKLKNYQIKSNLKEKEIQREILRSKFIH